VVVEKTAKNLKGPLFPHPVVIQSFSRFA